MKRIVAGTILAVLFAITMASVAFGTHFASAYDSTIQATVFSMRNEALTSIAAATTNIVDTKEQIAIDAIFLVVLLIWRKWREGIAFVIISAVAAGIMKLVKYAVVRERPIGMNLIEFPGDPSFPSGHTFGAVVICGLVIFIIFRLTSKGAPDRRKWPVVATVLAVLFVCYIAFTRVYLGMHWPTDTLGSMLLGGACLCFSTVIWDKVFPHAISRAE